MTKDNKPFNLPAGEWHEIEAIVVANLSSGGSTF
jgi:hypothetical protein